MDFVASCGDKTRFCSFTFKLIALFYLGDTLTLLSWWWKHTHIPLFLPTAKPSVVLIVSFIKHTEVNNRCFLKTACSLPAYRGGGEIRIQTINEMRRWKKAEWLVLHLSTAGQPMPRPRQMQLSRLPRPPTESPALPDWWPKSSPLPSTSQVSRHLHTTF